MKEFKGTPGPWIARIGFGIDVITNNDSAFGVCDIGNLNQLKDADYDFEDAMANAKLIAAAPDLLECLTKLVEAHETDNTKDYGFWVEAGRNAINKALDL